MSNEFHHKRRYSRYFMAPVWIALALCGMVVAFLLGGALVTDEWSQTGQREAGRSTSPGAPFVGPGASEPVVERGVGQPLGNPGTTETSPPKPESLSTLVWTSPASALEWAAEGVKHDRIEFAIYRNLLRAALAKQDASAHADRVSQHSRCPAVRRRFRRRSQGRTQRHGAAGLHHHDDEPGRHRRRGRAREGIAGRRNDDRQPGGSGSGADRREQGLLLRRRHLQGREGRLSPFCAAGAMRSARRMPPAGRKTIPTTWRRPCMAPR